MNDQESAKKVREVFESPQFDALTRHFIGNMQR